MNYDPNLTSCGKLAKQTVKLAFATWEYRAERTVEVGGNCLGFDVIDAAVSIVYDGLPSMSDGMGSMLPGIVLADPNDPTRELESTDDEERGDDWLKKKLIGVEIIAIRSDNNLYAETTDEEAKPLPEK